MKLTINEIIEATGAAIMKNELTLDTKFEFSTDTRTIKNTEIYLPLKGEKFDGEKFVDKAITAGSIGFFCTNEDLGKSFTNNSECKLILKVENTLTTYLELARFYRRKVNPTTVAITGSSGKTTTKEMAYCVACENFKTHKSELNFNNEIGFCKTVSEMPETTQVLIIEMGMRGMGEIELITKYAEPDIAIIANIGTAHIGRLGSRENIAKAKCEITNHLKENGILIAHDDVLIKNETKNRTQEKVFFSLDETKIINRSIGHSEFEYKNNNYELNIEGDYNIQNSLAAIEMGLRLKMSPKDIANGLKKYSPIEKRWEVQDIKGFKLINDSYNANPESMQGVIKTVLELYTPPILFVLGNMGELGENEIEYHQKIGEFLVKNIRKDINAITVGNLANEITKKLNDKNIASKNFADNLQTARYILDNIKFGTTIILKASRSMKLEEIINYLDEKE